MSFETRFVRPAAALLVAMSCVALVGGADAILEKRTPNIADQELFFAPVPKAVCGPGDKPETGLQGQVPAAMRTAGFQGFSCNLQLLAQIRGEGASWQNDEWREGKGRNRKACAYHSTNPPVGSGPGRVNYGVRAIDISNPAAPVTTSYLTTAAMLYPHEALKVNEKRKVLATIQGSAPTGEVGGGAGGPVFDVYDVSGDCRYPQLLSSTSLAVC